MDDCRQNPIIVRHHKDIVRNREYNLPHDTFNRQKYQPAQVLNGVEYILECSFRRSYKQLGEKIIIITH